MFVKLGQLAAGRSDLIGEEVAAAFARLQDAVAAAPPEEVRQLVEDELKRPLNDVFTSFDFEPIGAGKVHKAVGGSEIPLIFGRMDRLRRRSGKRTWRASSAVTR